LRRSLSIITAVFLLAAAPARADPPAYILVNADKGTVLGHNDADVLWHPASLTKLMTAYLTFEALKAGRLKTNSPVVVSANALAQPPSKMGYKVGTVLTVDNALKMLLVRSANDIAVAIAEAVGGSEKAFVARMNDTAARLGMASTHFDNPHGLPDDGQVTTARDLAVLAQALWAEFPDYRPYLGIPAIKAGKTVLRSHNALLEHYRGTNGMKTGFICASGFNLVASATRDERTLIAVVLGEDSWADLAERAAELLNDGFRPRLLSFAAEPELTAFAALQAPGPAIDMRDYGVCPKSAPAEQGEDTAADDIATSALEPRFELMKPVPVTTGGAAAPAKTARALGVPLPRLRPPAAPGG
jgi:D-alanyl-D-alanine carboxypeptidase